MKALISIIAIAGFAGVANAGPRDFIVEAAGVGGDKEAAAPYLEKFLRYIEAAAGWPPNSTSGEFAPEPADAIKFIESKKPGFGMFDPELWLELRKKHDLVVIATVEGVRQSEKMVIVAKDPALKKLDDLKGKKLASTHLQSPKYLSKVVFDGKIDVATFFVLQPVTSMIKSVKKVAAGDADAALLTDGEWNSPTVQGIGKELHIVASGKLPPTPVVVFNKVASAKDREAFEKALRKMCEDPKGADVCKQLDIKKFASPDKAAYDEAVRRYEK
ncbi:MAG TPA: PhnD/SsuA/transferrin family substrate-binding protein [Polyangia bacterium]|nr:PhnD/SsuA/transferrin family substrate-binding protein [Polyangia bacterium]